MYFCEAVFTKMENTYMAVLVLFNCFMKVLFLSGLFHLHS